MTDETDPGEQSTSAAGHFGSEWQPYRNQIGRMEIAPIGSGK
jgi:hypothetical protein